MDRCYYDNRLCVGELWQCLTCEEWFCEQHWHETSKGRDVECVACEFEREHLEKLEQEALNKAPLDRAIELLKLFAGMRHQIVDGLYEDLCNATDNLVREVQCQREIPF